MSYPEPSKREQAVMVPLIVVGLFWMFVLALAYPFPWWARWPIALMSGWALGSLLRQGVQSLRRKLKETL